jgi:hypothetical protein
VKDWNVVVTVYQDGFRPALQALQKLGPVERSPYHNLLVMKVDDQAGMALWTRAGLARHRLLRPD